MILQVAKSVPRMALHEICCMLNCIQKTTGLLDTISRVSCEAVGTKVHTLMYIQMYFADILHSGSALTFKCL